MAIEGAYEENGQVVIEYSNAAPSRLPWRVAIQRCQAISQAEHSVGVNRREEGVQRAIEQIIAAAREARKKAEADWSPPTSVSMFSVGNKQDIQRRKRAAASGLILPNS